MGLGFQASGSGRDREDWAWVSLVLPQLDGEWGLGVRERVWSELVNISTGVGSWWLQHSAAKEENEIEKSTCLVNGRARLH